MTTTTRPIVPYPLPTVERRLIVQALSDYARELDDEVEARKLGGSHNATVRHELMRSAGSVRLVATLVVNGTFGIDAARFWIEATRDYLKLVRRADRTGVIR